MWYWPDRIAATITKVFCLGVVAASFLSAPARADALAPPSPDMASSIAAVAGPPPQAAPVSVRVPKRAHFGEQVVPSVVRYMADWVVDSSDNHALPFVIIDKAGAKVFIFDATGQMLGSAWALVGLAQGDDSISGIGTMPLKAITPDMRTTPAGRFVATIGHDLGKLDVLWVDYPDAISLHRVINTDPTERRLERIVSQVPAEHRISYGCINVPAQFFDRVVDPTFKDTSGVVYILPEVKELQTVFPAYHNVDASSPVETALKGSVDDHDLAGIVH